MRDGRLTLDVEDGKIKGIYINAGLDEFYKRMFIKAKRIAKRYPENPENGIRVIIFGTFYLEAICNKLLESMLSFQIPHKELAQSICEAIKRLNILTKLDVAIMASSQDRTKSEKYKKKIQRVFDLRNRLAHFKDKDFPWMGSIKAEDLPNVLTNAPEPELMKELTGEKIQKYATDIKELDKWLRALFGKFVKSKTIRPRKK
jgi:hypothetical protein